MDLWKNATQADKNQLEDTARTQMRESIRNHLMQSLGECMGRGDWLILSIVGVDAQALFVEILDQETQALLLNTQAPMPLEES